MSLAMDMNNLSLNDKEIDTLCANTDLLDITSKIDELCDKLQPRTIIKNPYFDLFQGTHSLEVNNPKLDSFLIPLKACEAEFDCNIKHGSNKEQNLIYVTSIADRLVRCIVSWLNDYQSLPTTLLSCKYMEYLLNINSSHTVNIDKKINTGDPLYDCVLSDFIVSISYFAAFIKSLLFKRVIYEEEDLNFNSMGLLGFDRLPAQSDVLDSLNKTIKWVSDSNDLNPNDYTRHLINLLKLVQCLVQLENITTQYSTDTQYLDDLIQLATILNQTDLSFEVPQGSFSMSIQKFCSNQFPPKQIVTPERKNYLGFITMANDIKLILNVSRIDTAVELHQFVSFFNKLKQRHVLARALFPLFLVHQDGTIVGKYSFDDLLYSYFMEFSLMGAQISNNLVNHPNLSESLSMILQDCSNVLYEFYQNCSQNTARYRQGYNRLLLLLDSLQAQLETLESEFISNGMHDIVKSTNNNNNNNSNNPTTTITTTTFNVGNTEVPLMPYASWIFTIKVFAMIEFTLKGFDLEVYKPFEAFDMYYHVYHISNQLESCLNKISQFIKNKIDSIHSMNKKIKKLKAGEKKENSKMEYNRLMKEEMPQLQINRQYLKYLLLQCNINKSLSLFQVLQFSILRSVKLIDGVAPKTSKFVNQELLHNLRFKTFSSIGVPELPSFDIFQDILKSFTIKESLNTPMFHSQMTRMKQYMISQIDEAEESVTTIIKGIKSNDKNGEIYTGTRLVKEEALDYYNKYLGSTSGLRDNMEKIVKMIQNRETNEKNNYEVILQFQQGSSTFFPALTVVKKGKQANKETNKSI
ncbi:Mak10p PWA37_002890 [Arxiozyma heterogenica]|uniref:Mak10p n=1 Tax=Arxiozyma heterogenica TaxID=278026 RepID=UPI002EEF36C9